MIEYVVGLNPDDRKLERASRALSAGGLVAFPTDTNWVAAADPFSKPGVEKLYRLKKAEPQKHFSVLCDTISRASELAMIGDAAFRLIRGHVPGNFTFIFNAQLPIRKALKASRRDQEIGIRFPPSVLVQRLIAVHGGPLLSSNLTHEMLGLDSRDIEIYGFLIDDSLSGVIELVLDPGEFEIQGESTIVDLTDDTAPEIVRQGAGRWD